MGKDFHSRSTRRASRFLRARLKFQGARAYVTHPRTCANSFGNNRTRRAAAACNDVARTCMWKYTGGNRWFPRRWFTSSSQLPNQFTSLGLRKLVSLANVSIANESFQSDHVSLLKFFNQIRSSREIEIHNRILSKLTSEKSETLSLKIVHSFFLNFHKLFQKKKK